jgi:hypothetical protein
MWRLHKGRGGWAKIRNPKSEIRNGHRVPRYDDRDRCRSGGMADAGDLKSLGCKPVWVRIPPPAPSIPGWLTAPVGRSLAPDPAGGRRPTATRPSISATTTGRCLSARSNPTSGTIEVGLLVRPAHELTAESAGGRRLTSPHPSFSATATGRCFSPGTDPTSGTRLRSKLYFWTKLVTA